MAEEKKDILQLEEIFGDLTKAIDATSENPLASLQAILDLDEESFAILKETLLAEVEKTYNDPQVKILILQEIKEQGVFIEDVQEELAKAIDSIDESFGDEISESKKDFLRRLLGIFLNLVTAEQGTLHRIVNVPFQLCRKDAKAPTYAHITDAGMDVYATEDITIAPGETVIVPTGIKTAIPRGYALLVHPRSGLSRKTKLRVANTPGLIDSDYRDEIGVIIENIEPKIKDIEVDYVDGALLLKSIEYGRDFTISKGDRFAQLRLVEAPTANLIEVSDIGEFGANRGGGFGSTGTN